MGIIPKISNLEKHFGNNYDDNNDNINMDMQVSLPHEIFIAVEKELKFWSDKNNTKRLWEGDASLWTNSDEAKWLGWLTVTSLGMNELPILDILKKRVTEAGFTQVVVLGMGGSSLCPAMLASTFGQMENSPTLHVLDSTDPLQIRHLEESLDLKKTLFIVSSKSGGTLEPNIFKAYFYSRLQEKLGTKEVGDHFIAITDPNTKLEALAKKDHFMTVFYGVPSIGGRYSALSNFGIVPAKLMGMDLMRFLQQAEKMARATGPEIALDNNPGILLGVLLGVCSKFGKDKITFIITPEIKAFGAWLEQLLAESTGKLGKGLIPIDLEPLGTVDDYSMDRVFVVVSLENGSNDEQNKRIKMLAEAGHAVFQFKLQDKYQLAGEMFLWEMATAVAGSVIGINPFNQPDVEGSKVLAVQLINDYIKTGTLPKPKLLYAEQDIQLFTDDKNMNAIKREVSTKSGLSNEKLSLATYLKAHLDRVELNDYVNLSAFIEMSDAHFDLLQKIRIWIRNKKKVATCLGFGPRFLHSTGQAYKGGPNTGVFLQITAEHEANKDIKIPGVDYTFGLVIDAQAEADFQVLASRDRRVLRIHLGSNPEQGLKKIYEILQGSEK